MILEKKCGQITLSGDKKHVAAQVNKLSGNEI